MPPIGLSFATILAVGIASIGSAQTLAFREGRVSIKADAVPTAQVLAEWARTGKTEVVNGEQVATPPVTLTLQDAPESAALQELLAGVGGYLVVGKKGAVAPGESVFERILILPRAGSPAAPTTAERPTPNISMEAWPLPMNIDAQDPSAPVDAILTPAQPETGAWPLPMNIAPSDEEPGGGPKTVSVNPLGPPIPWPLEMNIAPSDESTAELQPPRDPDEPFEWPLPMNIDASPTWSEPQSTSTETGDDGLPIRVHIPLTVGLPFVPSVGFLPAPAPLLPNPRVRN